MDGTNDFTIEATDTNGCTGSNAYTIIVTNGTLDVTGPKIVISSPAANSSHTATPVAFAGTATDPTPNPSGVASVRFGVNGGPTNNPGTGTTAWTASVPLDPGTNTVAFQSVDNQGNYTTNAPTRKVFLAVPGTFTLATNVEAPYGFITPTAVLGDVSPTNGAPLKINRAYMVTAVVGSNHLFTNWTISVDGGPTVVATTSNKYTFVMASNVVLTANFITNGFIGAAGKYYGLFNDLGVAHQSAGWFNIKTDSKLKFSGKLLVQGEVVPVSGTFNQNGHGTLKPGKVFSRKGQTNVPIVIELDLNLATGDSITGTITNAEGWSGTLLGDKSTFAFITAPATNYMGGNGLGQFTFVYPGSLTAATEPGGDGYGLVTVKSNGFVSPTGGRAGDYQLRKSTVTSISKDGAWPFYAPMYKYFEARTSPTFTAKTYRGSVFGWLYLTNNTVSGDLFWNKIDWTNGIYDGGFTNTETIEGSDYIKPTLTQVLTGVSNLTALLTDGNVPVQITNSAHLAFNNNVFFTNSTPPVNPNGIKGKVATARGEFSGTFTNPATPTLKTSIKGVALQDQVAIRGVFVGTNQTGSIRLTE